MKNKILDLLFPLVLIGLTACQSNPPSSLNTAENSSPTATELTSTLPGEGVTVTLAHNTPGQQFMAEIFTIALEKLGYQVELRQLNPALMYAAIASDDVDFSPTHLDSYNQFINKNNIAKNIEVLGLITPNILQGYQIDQKTAQQYKITNIEQLKDPEIAKLFDTDGDGKANLSGCPAGSGCHEDISHHLEAYGLEDTVEQDQADMHALLADVVARYQQGEPVLFFSWTPSWQNTLLKLNQDVVWLEVPFTAVPQAVGNYTAEDTSADGKNLGFLVDNYRVVAHQDFLTANPSAKKLLEQIQIPPEDLGAELYRIYEGESDPKKVRQRAEEWVKNHQQEFESWVEAATTQDL